MDKFKIYIDRLKNGQTEKITATLPPSFLEIEEEELTFPEEVQVTGDVYLAEDHLVAHFIIETAVCIPCSVCNSAVKIPIAIRDHYFTELLEEIPSTSFDLSGGIREAILLQVPQFAECNTGNCPERDVLKNFLAKETPEKKQEIPQTVHFPFAELDK